ncbi:hypothetical protein AAY473_025591 [Plecturocebus cupreus]
MPLAIWLSRVGAGLCHDHTTEAVRRLRVPKGTKAYPYSHSPSCNISQATVSIQPVCLALPYPINAVTSDSGQACLPGTPRLAGVAEHSTLPGCVRRLPRPLAILASRGALPGHLVETPVTTAADGVEEVSFSIKFSFEASTGSTSSTTVSCW